MKKHFNITVIGKVQGVWYRGSAAKTAKQLNLNGFVKNLKNGNVYIEAEGEETELNQFINWCKMGPENAVVQNVRFEESELQNFIKFIIKRF